MLRHESNILLLKRVKVIMKGEILHTWKRLYKAFGVSSGSCVKSDKCPQLMSLESASV